MKALSIHKLEKIYKNNFHALKGVDLEVEEGDFFALLGSNGAGKSTTIGIITGLINKTAGQVKIFGTDIDDDPAKAKSYLGLVPQEFNFNQFEPLIEILINQAGYYGIDRKLASQRAEKYLRKLELWDKRNEMARELSGGMKRRLMIARALVHNPRLLILDEPTAGVDIEIRRSMWTFLSELNQQGVTIILTTHYLEEAESLCKNIAIIDHGITIEHSSMHALLNRLDRETIIFYLKDALHQLPTELQNHDMRLIDNNTIEADIHANFGMNKVFNLFNEQQITIKGMRNKSNRLEHLFICLLEKNRHNTALKETIQQTHAATE